MTDRSREAAREIARGLRGALQPLLGTGASKLHLAAARDVAQLLLLPGLDRLLAVLETHAGGAWPPELRAGVDRIQRMWTRCAEQESARVFHDGDRELGAMASQLEATEWQRVPDAPAAADRASERPAPGTASDRATGRSAAPPRIETLPLAKVIGDLHVTHGHDDAQAQDVRVSAHTAAVLRAALDWLLGEGDSSRPVKLSIDASTIELTCNDVNPAGLIPAHEVLCSVSGTLGPVGGVSGSTRSAWTLRVPSAVERPSYLMIIQGGVRLAVPWHAVLRVQLETSGSTTAGEQRIPRLTATSPASTTQPLVTLGLGLKRATLAADRVVWRLSGERVTVGTPPVRGVTHAVRTEDGETFWVLDLADLMRDVLVPPVPDVRRQHPHAPVQPRVRLHVLSNDDVEPLATTPTADGTRREPVVAREEDAVVGTSFEPAPHAAPHLERPAREAHTPASPAASDAAPSTPPVAPGSRHARRALIAEDSLTARVFLSRMLQQMGFEVRAVERASELREAIGTGTWSLICVDVELPDARGTRFIAQIAETQFTRPSPAAVVALVRDGADVRAAAAAGVRRTLHKPFDQSAVIALLHRIGLPVARPA